MKDGKSAFPVFDSTVTRADYECVDVGMSLRDWFAGQALKVILPSAPDPESLEVLSNMASALAKAAYIVADAMIIQSGKGEKA
jgi:hypothetical protein